MLSDLPCRLATQSDNFALQTVASLKSAPSTWLVAREMAQDLAHATHHPNVIQHVRAQRMASVILSADGLRLLSSLLR
eukprot:2418506-Amphidinium_carterae.1